MSDFDPNNTSARDIIDRYNAGERDFRNANLEGEKFEGEDLSKADFTGANMKRTYIYGNDFKEAIFEGANFEGAKILQTYFENTNFKKAVLINTEINQVTFKEADLAEAKFTGSTFSQVDFTKANLLSALLNNTALKNSSFQNANLTGATLRGSRLESVVLTDVNFTATDLEDTNLTEDYGHGFDFDRWGYLIPVPLPGFDSFEQIQPLPSSPVEEKEEVKIKIPAIKVKANLNAKVVDFIDPITQDEFNGSIEEYINEDEKNIVIVYQKELKKTRSDKYFLTNRDTIDMVYNDENIVYPCKKTSIAFKPREENIIDMRLFDLHKLGFIEVNQQYCDMEKYDNNKDNQLFAIVDLKKKYDSFVSHYVRTNPNPNVVSDLHCQEGQEGRICKLIVAIPSTKDNPETLVYGRKNKKSKKQKRSKKQRKRKSTIKTKKVKKIM